MCVSLSNLITTRHKNSTLACSIWLNNNYKLTKKLRSSA